MKWNGKLDSESIHRVLVLAENECKRIGTSNDRQLRFLLSLEELLLLSRSHCGENGSVRLITRQHNRILTVELLLPSGYEGQDMEDSFLAGLLADWHPSDKRAGALIYTLPVEQTRWDLLHFAWKYTRPHKGWFILGVLTQMTSVVLQIIAPLIMARVIVSLTEGVVEQIMLTALSLLLIDCISNVVNITCNRAYNVVYNKTLTLIEKDLVHETLRITTRCLDQKGAGLFIQRLTQDTSQIATGFNTLADLISQSVEKIGILVAVLILNRLVFAVMIGILVIQAVIETIRTRRLKADGHIYRDANERYTDFVNEMIHGAKDVKLTHSEAAFEGELVRRITDANGKRMRMQNRSAMFSLLRMEIGSFGTYAFVALLAMLIGRGKLPVTDAIILFNYRSNVGVSAIQLIGSLMQFLRDLELSTERVVAILRSPEFPKDKPGTRHLEQVRGEIRFDRVSFSYEPAFIRHSRKWVLKDMSFVIHPGESVALVGTSGCGKTTVLNLISRLYDASHGTVTIDGVDIRELDNESIRGNISVVSQNPYLFHLSIRENLRLVKPDMTEEEMRTACKMACIDQDIEETPDGYNTIVDENGVNLSGGQRQRLAIARALLKQSRILMLDEATSALDNLTQARIQQAIENVRGDRTVITIAHRLSTVIHADRILFIRDGQVIDQGSHQDLLAHCADYRKLYEAELGQV
ncbi:MAG: ABC transporter ATP-binding protein [Clostridia bacterium]|nr:ABC transporter ATP-binding protein [Clostridia bacterium]